MQVKVPPFKWTEVAKLLPLLILFLGYLFMHEKPHLRGDEFRYMINVHNILQGFFASEESLMFWNGPGYPLYLAPFVALKLPLMLPRIGNTFFLFFAVVYFQSSLKILGIEKRLWFYSSIFGLVMLMHGALVDMLFTESLCAFLICGSVNHFFKLIYFDQHRGLNLIAAGFLLGYLIWTKVFFGYVVEVTFLFALCAWLFLWIQKSSTQFTAHLKAVVHITGVALLFSLPYLVYTYKITGKVHFWGNSGGLLLYSLSVPEKKLVGDWLNFDTVRDHPEFFQHETEIFVEMSKLDLVARDSAFKALAIKNIKANPKKFFWNWRANVNRLVFGFPVSPYPGSDLELKTGNRTFFYAIPFLLFFFAIIPGWLGRRKIPMGAHLVLAFGVVSLVGLSILSCIPRQAFPLLPILLLWTVLVVEKVLAFSRS